ncbi:MAG: hypothetical protein U1F11_05865 [Steroidobacteraceae bacterium]
MFVESGGTPKAAKVVDASGAALGVVQVDLQLDPAHPFAIGPGARSHLALDFNLAATNTVDLTTTPATVKARPVFVASLAPPTAASCACAAGSPRSTTRPAPSRSTSSPSTTTAPTAAR